MQKNCSGVTSTNLLDHYPSRCGSVNTIELDEESQRNGFKLVTDVHPLLTQYIRFSHSPYSSSDSGYVTPKIGQKLDNIAEAVEQRLSSKSKLQKIRSYDDVLKFSCVEQILKKSNSKSHGLLFNTHVQHAKNRSYADVVKGFNSNGSETPCSVASMSFSLAFE